MQHLRLNRFETEMSLYRHTRRNGPRNTLKRWEYLRVGVGMTLQVIKEVYHAFSLLDFSPTEQLLMIRKGTVSCGSYCADQYNAFDFSQHEHVKRFHEKTQRRIYLFFKDNPHGSFFLLTSQALGQQHIPARFGSVRIKGDKNQRARQSHEMT